MNKLKNYKIFILKSTIRKAKDALVWDIKNETDLDMLKFQMGKTVRKLEDRLEWLDKMVKKK